MRRLPLIALVVLLLLEMCSAQTTELRVPTAVTAGNEATVSTAGNGKATFYLLGPGVAAKNDLTLGQEIHLPPQELRNAGAYQAILCSDTCRNATFYVSAAAPARLIFLVHPSRVPVRQDDAVSGVAFPFDQFRNLVLAPVTVNFQLTAGNASLFSRTERSQDGLAWFRTTSGKSAGALQVTVALSDLSERRVVQQVASDPCNLRIKGQRDATGILVETEPVHDCAGNTVPDGTIIAFTETDAEGKSTVDAPIKQGIARAQMMAANSAVISVASGVVMGNELRIGPQP
jgi:hypothetical protein